MLGNCGRSKAKIFGLEIPAASNTSSASLSDLFLSDGHLYLKRVNGQTAGCLRGKNGEECANYGVIEIDQLLYLGFQLPSSCACLLFVIFGPNNLKYFRCGRISWLGSEHSSTLDFRILHRCHLQAH